MAALIIGGAARAGKRLHAGPRRSHDARPLRYPAPMLALTLTPAVFSALVLAAHFLRRGQLVACALCLAAASLAFVRASWAPRVLQAFLLLGVLEWVRTLVALLAERRAAGEPAGRLVAIIGGVIAVALLGAALAGTRRVLDRARGASRQETQ